MNSLPEYCHISTPHLMSSNHKSHSLHSCNCGCCAAQSLHVAGAAWNRRDFLFRVGTATAAGLALSALDTFAADPTLALPARGPLPRRALQVQPVLTYAL